MGVSTGDDGGPAGTAGADGEKGIVKTHAAIGELLDVGGVDTWVSVGRAVIPGHVIGDDQHDVGTSGGTVGGDNQ